MAQLLIMAQDNTHPDPVKDARGSWKRGMVVEVFEDDKVLTRPMPAPFFVIKISGLTKALAEKYLEAAYSSVAVDGDGNPALLCRRKYGLAWDAIPKQVQNTLNRDRYYETTWAFIRPYVRDRITGVSE